MLNTIGGSIIYVSIKKAVNSIHKNFGFEVKSDIHFRNNMKWIEVAPKELKLNTKLT